MYRPNGHGAGKSAGNGISFFYGPVLIILALLAGWLLVTNWDRLPHFIASAVAAIH